MPGLDQLVRDIVAITLPKAKENGEEIFWVQMLAELAAAFPELVFGTADEAKSETSFFTSALLPWIVSWASTEARDELSTPLLFDILYNYFEHVSSQKGTTCATYTATDRGAKHVQIQKSCTDSGRESLQKLLQREGPIFYFSCCARCVEQHQTSNGPVSSLMIMPYTYSMHSKPALPPILISISWGSSYQAPTIKFVSLHDVL